ncbi:MAG TPA: hypothetical protein VK749_19570, partial [Xanthobacteraceae bacterium]|nr:hypothetical protein [Xanthobacteraceae bacterium]
EPEPVTTAMWFCRRPGICADPLAEASSQHSNDGSAPRAAQRLVNETKRPLGGCSLQATMEIEP